MASHCHDEHDGHHDGAGVHDHSDDVVPALQSLLYDKIDFGNIRTLNETATGSGAAIVKKPWADRLTPEPELESSADEQLLMFIPYA
jgi:PITH domain